jgi:hypothetical protein
VTSRGSYAGIRRYDHDPEALKALYALILRCAWVESPLLSGPLSRGE